MGKEHLHKCIITVCNHRNPALFLRSLRLLMLAFGFLFILPYSQIHNSYNNFNISPEKGSPITFPSDNDNGYLSYIRKSGVPASDSFSWMSTICRFKMGKFGSQGSFGNCCKPFLQTFILSSVASLFAFQRRLFLKFSRGSGVSILFNHLRYLVPRSVHFFPEASNPNLSSSTTSCLYLDLYRAQQQPVLF